MQESMLHHNRYSNVGFADAPKRKASLDLQKPGVADKEVECLGRDLSSGADAVLMRSCGRQKNVMYGSREALMGQKVRSSDGIKKAEAEVNVLKDGRFRSTKEASKHAPTKKQNDEEEKESFKSMLAMEIKRQVLDGLGKAGNAQVEDVQVVEIEDIKSIIEVTHNGNSEEKSRNSNRESYAVKVKLLATVCIPIVLQSAKTNPQTTVSGQPLEQSHTEENPEEEKILKVRLDSSLHPMSLQTGKSSQELQADPRSQVASTKPCRTFEEHHNQQEHPELQRKGEEQKVSQMVRFDGSLHRVSLNEHDTNANSMDLDNIARHPCDISTRKDRFESLLDVDDFEIYDFDTVRSEDKFVKGQIWALYDDRDGMPRHYAQIMEVISISPFKVSICWLEPKTQSIEALMRMASGISVTCGEYELSKHQDSIELSHVEHFSHAVRSQVGSKGEILISPSKGEVWALYKNPVPFSDTSEIMRGMYELVQVVDKDMKSSVTVVPLTKVAGFRTRFVQEKWHFTIAKTDFREFSHQIPAYKLSQEPRVYLELDPASTPKP